MGSTGGGGLFCRCSSCSFVYAERLMGSTGGGGANIASRWKEMYDEKLPFLRFC